MYLYPSYLAYSIVTMLLREAREAILRENTMSLVLGIPRVGSFLEIVGILMNSGHYNIRLWSSEELQGQIWDSLALRRKSEPTVGSSCRRESKLES